MTQPTRLVGTFGHMPPEYAIHSPLLNILQLLLLFGMLRYLFRSQHLKLVH